MKLYTKPSIVSKLVLTCITLCLGFSGFAQKWDEIIKATASDRSVLDGYSVSISISGNFAIVGAYQEDDDALGGNKKINAGSAYILERNEAGTWQEVQKIVALDRASYDEFGQSVSISGNYAIVGAWYEEQNAMGVANMAKAGSAYIFQRNGLGVWNQIQKIVASDRAPNDYFGVSVSISGDYVIVGAMWEDNDSLGLTHKINAGSAYIFERDNVQGWLEVQKIGASDREIDDEFGAFVSISGIFAIVGAMYEDDDTAGNNSLSNAGSAYVFERNGSGKWNQVQKLVSSDRETDDNFGWSLSISGNYLIVGARYQDKDLVGGNPMIDAGSAYIFERSGNGVWQEVQKLVSSDRAAGDLFGISVSISGDFAIVGAMHESEDTLGSSTLPKAGSAYIFKRNGIGVWDEVQKVIASDRAIEDRFGSRVGISGNYALVAAISEDENATGGSPMNNSGSAYFFETNGNIGITENDFGNELSIYPNPTEGNFSIVLGKTFQRATVTITDLTGRIIQTNTYNESQVLDLNLEEVAGVYLLIVEAENKKAVIRIVKK